MLERGIAGERTFVVTKDLTAKTMGSGELEVLATPAMIALIEETAWRSVASWLAPGQGTVGTKLEVSHVSATPVGLTVRCRTELTEIDRRKLVFSVSVYDDAGLIGEGTHERFIVDNDRFMAKAESKKKAPQKD